MILYVGFDACTSKFTLFSPQGDEGESKSGTVPMEEEEDDDDDPENRYDSIHKDCKKIITHPRRKRNQRNTKQVVKTRSACLVKTRSRASRKFEREARKQTPKPRKKRK